MRQPIIERLYGPEFPGVAEVEGQPWPRRDTVAQGGQALRGVPDAWRDACRRMESARPEAEARALERPGMLVEPPDEMCREAYAKALHEAEALPDDDPDKTVLVAVRRDDLWSIFDRPPRSPEERRAVLRAFLDDPER